MRSPGYDLKYYLGTNSTWLHGKGAYYQDIDYVTEYRFTNTVGSTAGKLSRVCHEGCNYFTNVNVPPDFGFGNMHIDIAGGYAGAAFEIDYVFYTNNLASYDSSFSSESLVP
jgi:hypothetical protein